MDHVNRATSDHPGGPAGVGRHRWQRLDLRCLQCGRALGALLQPDMDERPAAGSSPRIAFFRSADASVPIRRLAGPERLACAICGGRPLVDEVRRFSVYQEAPGELDEEEQPGRRRRGRPAKPWRRPSHWSSTELGIAG